MIQMTTKSLLGLIQASNEVAVELDRMHGAYEDTFERLEDSIRDHKSQDMEMDEMRVAAADLSRSYSELQEYVGAKDEENLFLRGELRRVEGLAQEQSDLAAQAIAALKDGVPLVLVTAGNVARLITAMTVGNKGQIGEAVRAILPDLGLHDAIQLATDAVKSASGVIDTGEEDKPVRYVGAQRQGTDGPIRRDTIPFEVVKAPQEPIVLPVLTDDDEPTMVMPSITAGVRTEYPINGASVG